MIQSVDNRKQIIDAIEQWAKHVKVKHLLREYDIPDLADRVMDIFYHITLCCGHMVLDMDEGIHIEFKEYDGSTISGLYCKDCAEKYKKELGAWEVPHD